MDSEILLLWFASFVCSWFSRDIYIDSARFCFKLANATHGVKSISEIFGELKSERKEDL